MHQLFSAFFCSKLNNESTLIGVDDFKMVLREHFRNLSDDDAKEFVKCARIDCKNYFRKEFNDTIDFRVLFLVNDLDRQYGMFLNKCICVLRSIRKSFVSRLCFYLIKAQLDVNSNKKKKKSSIEISNKKQLNNKKLILKRKKKKLKKKSTIKKLSLNSDEKILELINNVNLIEELSRVKVSVATFEHAIKQIDPNITNDELNAHTKWLLRNLDSQSTKEINMKLIVTELVKTNVLFH